MIIQKIIVGPSESMSKSKKNTVDPESIISTKGADAARLFISSDSPPEKDVQWSEEGIVCHINIQKLWNLNSKILDEIKNHLKDVDEKFEKKLISLKNTVNLDTFSYNKLIANLHEIYAFLIKYLGKYKKETLIKIMRKF